MTDINSLNTQELVYNINHQKAEIERYKGVIKLLEDDVASAKKETEVTEMLLEEKNKDISALIFKERSNAIIEFAEMLKDGFNTDGGTFECSEIEDNIDDLVKEMTEVEE